MNIDDLRARMHAHAKNLHEYDVDKHASDAAFAVRREELSAEAATIAVDLQNYHPTPEPTTPATSPMEYARFCYNDPDITAKWTVQTLQGQPETVKRLPALRQVGVKKLYRYTFPLTWTDHPHAARRMASDPATFDRAWLATRNGNWIRSTKFDAGDGYGHYLVDVGITAYQQASAQWLINLCRSQGWDGVYLDEINESTSYAGYLLPSNYATQYRFQLAILAYVQYVAAALHTAGLEVHANLASNDTAWRRNIATVVDGVCMEFFMVQWTVDDPDAWHLASLENGEYKRQLDWLVWNENAGKRTICQADARSEAQVQYALASLLLVTTGKARFAATKGGAGLTSAWWTPAMDTVKLLGQPKTPYTVTTSGVYQRDFEHGRVSVNPSDRPINTMPATSGLIELR